jgi:hypothetical protein
MTWPLSLPKTRWPTTASTIESRKSPTTISVASLATPIVV